MNRDENELCHTKASVRSLCLDLAYALTRAHILETFLDQDLDQDLANSLGRIVGGIRIQVIDMNLNLARALYLNDHEMEKKKTMKGGPDAPVS